METNGEREIETEQGQNVRHRKRAKKNSEIHRSWETDDLKKEIAMEQD